MDITDDDANRHLTQITDDLFDFMRDQLGANHEQATELLLFALTRLGNTRLMEGTWDVRH